MILDYYNNKLSVKIFRYILKLGRLKVHWKKMEKPSFDCINMKKKFNF